MGSINRDDVRHVARLARLALPEEHITTITGQLESILDYVSHLQSIDTTGVPPTTRAVEVVNVMRADQVQPTAVRDDLLNQAPQREADLLLVPRILAE
ncbi:MAG: Asp-tRNA(Asn)/Glu-tRNA(Gln) amidotransferase subunit GatC [Synechococcus sp. SB0666_bin_14]|nr:Asp-tRNA(Asn)/Glu-tRNA(Gln) amidotransferase subunit GatC [Synechococcus sp. SB0666_bin_14]MYA91115.1 Asp-tRNA(Asn)/Glu-tRNA(Gln) amidotransferase subunit GatC [Synechococcus sp. SB0663_bin_10]MYG46948.1 Asp-tRNA(Asn)/Glu-tRNA(Gln) amidotransferase subunit GatC [Synechococcus sp. SB0675_bin_6]MYJ59572.1 Asp-tRNA(Asn)/Glu-tRNA(Gln) amidotransferase subunit GatC [Synechococcus sp. SB0672_bin_6]MYK91859.1 Asp-tRNA(Asn)/Glu-tRNA(Gln) amidotransferase subunit GatC [Synechococcus sp. SB0669_bin_8]